MNNEPKIHNGQAPARRRPDDEPEHRGDGELDEGPATGSVQMRDEDYAKTDQPLLPGTEAADKLHSNRKRAPDQLTTGSGGDAGRPGKEGVYGDPIPPREDVG